MSERGRPAYWRGIVVACGLALAVGITAAVVRADGADDDPHASLLAKADSIAKKVSVMRGLPIKRKIKRGVMAKHEIRKRILERMDEEYSPEELAAEQLAMKRMGMLPAGADYKKLVIDLLTDEIAGFYDPWERQLYIAGWQPRVPGFEDGVMAHEIAHALQDQHFDLRKLMKPVEQNGDASAARQALVEGDGMALMVEFMMPGSASPWSDPRVLRAMSASVASGGSATMLSAPLILREGLVFPYTKGLEFVAHFRKHHSWKRIDKIYRKPPLATEQILHPSKYETYERPDEIKAAKPAALGQLVKHYDNVSGELGLALLLRQHGIAQARAEIAAEGWGGDRLAVFAPVEHGGRAAQAVGILYTVWDHEADALEFYEAMVDALPQLALGAGPVAAGDEPVADGLSIYQGTGGQFSVQRKGDAVVVIAGAAPTAARKLRAQVWNGWKVRRR